MFGERIAGAPRWAVGVTALALCAIGALIPLAVHRGSARPARVAVAGVVEAGPTSDTAPPANTSPVRLGAVNGSGAPSWLSLLVGAAASPQGAQRAARAGIVVALAPAGTSSHLRHVQGVSFLSQQTVVSGLIGLP